MTLREATRVWARIGLLSFGGPAGQIALMHDELVEKRRWIGEARFLHALNYCMLLPGPEAQQLAVYIGWLLHRIPGGVVAGTLFVLPGAVTMLALSTSYAMFHELPAVAALFFGLKAAVLAVVVEAVVRVGKRALRARSAYAIAAAAFTAIFFFGVPFPFVIVAAGVIGAVLDRWIPALPPREVGGATGASTTVVDAMEAAGELGHTRPSRWRALRVLLSCLALWWAPVGAVALLLGPRSTLATEGFFFGQAAVVTFGGAYAVLAYIAQEAVGTYRWLRPGEMLDGLGLAETTPGPLIMVVQFVAFVGAYRHPEGLAPLVAGVLGSAMTVWVTFVPCFLWIFLGGPYIEALRGNRRLNAALSAITAAIVGVITNLSLWFAVHVVFRVVGEVNVGVLHVLRPDPASIDLPALALAVFAMVAMFRFKLGLAKTLAASALLGATWKLLGTHLPAVLP